jgi:hypothetical protein
MVGQQVEGQLHAEGQQQEVSSERITITDARRAGFCVLGIRDYARANGVAFRDFLRNGIAADDERIAGDAHIERVLAVKRKGTR